MSSQSVAKSPRKKTSKAVVKKTPKPPRIAPFENVRDLRDRLGGVPLDRILLHPAPGTATVKDVLRHVDREPKKLVELVDGTLVEKAMGIDEAWYAMRLGSYLTVFADQHSLGMVVGADGTIRLKGGNVRLPDVGFYSSTRWAMKEPGKAVPQMSPEIAVESLSKSNTKKEMLKKRREYFASGSIVVWELDPKRKMVTVYREAETAERTLTVKDSLDAPDVLPGFSIVIEKIFRGGSGR